MALVIKKAERKKPPFIIKKAVCPLKLTSKYSPSARFWKQTQQTETCWIWTGHTNKGYGVIRVNNKAMGAHRYSWELRYDLKIPKGLFVCHSCDNPICVNPDHLFLGTLQDNVADMVSKGRQATGLRNGHHTKPEKTMRGDNHYFRKTPEKRPRPNGELNGRVKLLTEQVQEIRTKYIPRIYTMQKLADEYDVSKQAIYAILKRKLWRHI